MDRLETALARFSHALLVVAALAVLSMTALVVLSVLMRYGVGSPFAFTEELVALVYLAMVFCTIPIGTIRREHIAVTAGVDRAGPRLRRLLAVLAALVMIIFAAWFVYETVVFTAFSRQIGARSDHVGILLWPWMALMPLTMALVGAIALLRGWQALRQLRAGVDPTPERLSGDRL